MQKLYHELLMFSDAFIFKLHSNVKDGYGSTYLELNF